MALTPDQLTEAQNWITNSGWGTFSPSGGFALNDGTLTSTDESAQHILGAAQSLGYNSADVSQILRGTYSPDQIDSFASTNKPLIDSAQGVFEADRARNTPATPQTSSTLGLGSIAPPNASGPNPYMSQMADEIGRRSNLALGQGLQGIRSNAIGVGGLGGSRQGVAEGLAISNANDSLQGNLATLYGNDWNNSQNRGLQRYGMDQNYNLGLGNLSLGMQNSAQNYDLGLRGSDLGYAGLDAQINQNNFNNNMAGVNFGLGLWNQGMQNNQTGINAGTNINNTAMNYWSNFGNQYNSIGQGYGTTTGSTNQQGNPFMGALGGAQLGSRIGNMWGGSGQGNNYGPGNTNNVFNGVDVSPWSQG